MTTPKKTAKPDAVATPGQPLLGHGVDIGTANIASARYGVSEVEITMHRDCFISFPAEEQMNLEAAGVTVYSSEDGNNLFVVGADAVTIAGVLGGQLRRPLARGFVSEKEDLSKEVLNLLLRSSMGPARVEGELAVFSVPGVPLDGDTAKAQYHTRFFSDRLKELGYKPMPINEAMALVYAETQTPTDDTPPLTALSLSFGAGMINIALVYKSMLIRSFSLPFGGDFIDESAAKATNSPLTQVTILKEGGDVGGVDLLTGKIVNQTTFHDTQSERQAEAISLMYRELLTKLRDAMNDFFSRSENRVEIPENIPVLVGGGTTCAPGFLKLFDELVLSELDLRFPHSTNATQAADPLYAVAMGALKMARFRISSAK
jgi:hypothetical protein